MSNWFSGYAIGKEDVGYLKANNTKLTQEVLRYSIPERVDPWSLDGKLMPTEDQKTQGSCSGHALSECYEYCCYVASGEVKQFSRQMAYLGAQRMDGISGDNGSTLSGGTKLASEYGLCLESTYPYLSAYPREGWKNIPQAAWDEAKRFLLKSATDIDGSEAARQYLGAGLGIIHIGIAWNDRFSPDSKGCIRSFNPGSNFGGHAIVLCGYVPDSDIGVKSSKGYWIILKNSWSQRWGIRGRAYLDPIVVDQMAKHKFTVMLGRSDLTVPKPRPVPIDWTKPDKGMIA